MRGPGRDRAAATAWALVWVALAAVGCTDDTAAAGKEAVATQDGVGADGSAGDGAGAGPADAEGDSATADDASDAAGADGGMAGDAAADGQGVDVGDHVIEAKTPQALETDEAGKSGDLVFEIPANTAGFALTATAEAKVHLAFEGLIAPDGAAIVPAGWIEKDVGTGGQMCLSCKIRVAPQQGSSAILVPNVPGVEATPGTWTVRVRAWTQTGGGFTLPKKTPYKGTVSVTLALQPGPLTAFGRIDLNVFWSGAEGYTAASAAGDAKVQGWLQRYAELYAQVGLSVGAVRHFDLPAGHQVVEAMASDNSGFADLAALTASAPPGLNLVMVREITSPFGGMGAVLGVSGGIPGPVAVPGAARSMVVVAFPDIPAGFGSPAKSHDVGLTIAHEGGHYLGLFHSSENDFGGFGPKLHDPLPDTPEKDTTNLMYFDGGSGGAKLSAQQGAVLRTNPWVQLLSSMGGQP